MVKRKKSKGAGDQLSEFVVDAASGDMPIESVIRADKGQNPAADALQPAPAASTTVYTR